MSVSQYPRNGTALLVVDPYNDFLAEEGLIWPRIKEIAQEVRLLENLRYLYACVRSAGIRLFIVPHRQWQPGDYEGWEFVNPTQQRIMRRHSFAKGTWGGEFHCDFAPRRGDVVVSQHWGQSGFANTDLDLQLKQHGITHVILVGLLANTCIESTGRFAMEFGYHVTLVRDATAAATPEMMQAAHEINGPEFAHAIVTTKELLGALRHDHRVPQRDPKSFTDPRV